jgi:hypothetical protein
LQRQEQEKEQTTYSYFQRQNEHDPEVFFDKKV